MGLEGFSRKKPQTSESISATAIPEVERTLNGLQSQLMLQAHHEHHPDVEVDVEHPENNSHEVRNEAAMEWITGGSAALFREFAESGQLNTEQARDLHKLLEDMRERGSIH